MIRSRAIDGVAVLELDHGKANALDVELCHELDRRLREHRRAPSAALVLTGRGAIFSAGVDLLRLLDEGSPYTTRLLRALGAALESLFMHPKPVVAALNGHAIAGGCVLACAADYRLMARGTARVGVPELRVGVPFPSAALEIMRFALEARRFRDLMFRGATVDPEAAVEWGLIDAIVPPERLIERAVAQARDLASLPPGAFRLTKLEIRAPYHGRMKAARRGHDEAVRKAWASPLTREAIRGYVERTFRRAAPLTGGAPGGPPGTRRR